jgi:hypothetical protein
LSYEAYVLVRNLNSVPNCRQSEITSFVVFRLAKQDTALLKLASLKELVGQCGGAFTAADGPSADSVDESSSDELLPDNHNQNVAVKSYGNYNSGGIKTEILTVCRDSQVH